MTENNFLLYTEENSWHLIAYLGRSQFIFAHLIVESHWHNTNYTFLWRTKIVIYGIPDHKSSWKNSIIFEFGTVRLQGLNFLITLQLIPLRTDFFNTFKTRENEEYTEEVVHKR